MTDVPALVGLCPGAHTGEFYMPLDPGEGTDCPECGEPMVVFAPTTGPSTVAVGRADLVDALSLLSIERRPDTRWGGVDRLHRALTSRAEAER